MFIYLAHGLIWSCMIPSDLLLFLCYLFVPLLSFSVLFCFFFLFVLFSFFSSSGLVSYYLTSSYLLIFSSVLITSLSPMYWFSYTGILLCSCPHCQGALGVLCVYCVGCCWTSESLAQPSLFQSRCRQTHLPHQLIVHNLSPQQTPAQGTYLCVCSLSVTEAPHSQTHTCYLCAWSCVVGRLGGFALVRYG